MTLPPFDIRTVVEALACLILLNLTSNFFILVRVVRKQGNTSTIQRGLSPENVGAVGSVESETKALVAPAPGPTEGGLQPLALNESLAPLIREVDQLKRDLTSIKTNEFGSITFEFDEIFRRERSRLASPYPRLFRIDDLPGEPAIYEKVGLIWKGRISFYPLCEHDACKALRQRKELQQRYVFSGSRLTITPKFIGNVIKVAFMAYGHQIHGVDLPITFVDPSAIGMATEAANLMKEAADTVKEAAAMVPVPVKEIGEHLEPDILGASVEKLIKHLTNEPKELLNLREKGAWQALKIQLEAEIKSQFVGREAAMIETGSTGHLLMGKLMEKQDSREEERVPHGGLVRVLKEEKTSEGRVARSKYLWVCEECRNAIHPEYKLLSTTAPTP